MGTLNMLGLAKRVGARFLLTSTSEVYGDPLQHPQKEEYWGNVNPIGVRSCYDEGKRVAETLAFDYHRQEDVEIRVVRKRNCLRTRAGGRIFLKHPSRVIFQSYDARATRPCEMISSSGPSPTDTRTVRICVSGASGGFSRERETPWSGLAVMNATLLHRLCARNVFFFFFPLSISTARTSSIGWVKELRTSRRAFSTPTGHACSSRTAAWCPTL